MLRTIVKTSILWMCALLSSHALDAQVCTPVKPLLPVCSYSALNGACNLTIDRLNATNPPTIYARRGAVITVQVVDMSAFEKLSLDATYPTEVLPPDPFSQAMAALSATLGKLTIVNPQHSLGLEGSNQTIKYDAIIAKQMALKDKLSKIDPLQKAETAFKLINQALQTPPADICSSGNGQAANDPWLDFKTWKANVITGLTPALDEVSETKLKGFLSDYDAIQTLIAQLVDLVDYPAQALGAVLTLRLSVRTQRGPRQSR